jgi:tRNA-splicing ligase RtcB
MGETSWVMLATRDAMQKSFGSACHGAGRTMSRHEANHHAEPVALDEELESKGVRVRSSGDSASAGGVRLKENIDGVVETVAGARLASKVARLKPLAVMHG